MSEIEIGRVAAQAPGLKVDASAARDPLNDRFANLLSGVIGDVNRAQNAAEDAAGALVRDEIGTLEAVVAMNEADLSLRMLMQVRNRALSAYQQILRSV